MILCQKDATVHSPSYCILLPERAFRDKKSDDIIYFFAAGDVSRETSLAAKAARRNGCFRRPRYWLLEFNFTPLQVFVRHLQSGLTLSKQKLISSSYLLVIKNLHATMFSLRSFEISGNRQESVFRALWLATQTWDIQCFWAVRATPNSRRTNGFPACCGI